MRRVLVMTSVLGALLLPALSPAAAQRFACAGDAHDEQLLTLASQVPDPAAFLYVWLRLAVRAQTAGVPVPEVWETFCVVFTAAWDADSGALGQLATQATAATAVAGRWPQLPPLAPPQPAALGPAGAEVTGPAPGTAPRAPAGAGGSYVPPPQGSVLGGTFLVEVGAVTPTGVTLSWLAPPGADAYEVSTASEQGLRLASRRVYAPGGPRAGTVTTTVGGLAPGHTYRFDVRALRAAGSEGFIEVGRSPSVGATTPRPVVPTPTPFSPPGPERSRSLPQLP